ncbi:hypothetical protein GCM10007079_25970 [Nocardiopsis terrae]|uniref:Amino acid adenylation domain-containing protein n=1 Tax=Nocardiopsis terrae TaxID=372655 RepID=A0ABR9HFL2_9ACTN|nr:amino acid adenylation domain-containing protein [Nocardiopsis terrae]MBE1457799.1 amino acid adenylation domain-containing protein [Nocardiopsis terrae]GHC84205.1 hypothetical protein GCM10007079_25970 [Nocardiopsis terrae]
MTADTTAPPVEETTGRTIVWTAPVTESQAGLLVVERSVPTANLYNVLAELRLDPGYTAADVRSAMAAVLAVQPNLRLSLLEDPEPHAALGVPPPDDDLPLVQETVEGSIEERRDEVVRELAETAFDTSRAPLIRAHHLRSAAGDDSRFVFVVHHTVFDGFSLQPMAKDFDSALLGRLDTEAVRPAREHALLHELRAQHKAEGSSRVEKNASEIGRLVRQVPATTIYPRPERSKETRFQGRRRTVSLGAQVSEAVDRACARWSVTPFEFFSAVYGAVLARHTGQRRVVFGSPLLSRRTVGSYDLCGFFVNTLPVVLDVDWDAEFAHYLREAVQPEARKVRSRSSVPFSRVVRYADPDRGTNRNPVFSVMLAMQDSTSVALGGAVTGIREHAPGTAKFDLWLGVTPTPEGWLLEVDHDLELVPDPVAQAVARSLHGAVASAATADSIKLRDLFADESLRLSRTTDGYGLEPPYADLDAWLRNTAEHRADAVAVEESDRSMNYRQLNREVDRVCAGLRRRGVGSGDVVGLAADSLVETVVAVMSVLRVGGLYLPLDRTLPTERLSYMLAKADCRIIIGQHGVGGLPAVPLDSLAEDTSAEPSGTEGAGGYVMFTSGSTGQPKGVAMPNGPLLNLTAWQIEALGMSARTRFLQYAPLGFDVSFQEIVPTLAAGGTVISREPADRRDLPAVVRRVVESAATHVYLPAAALRPFAQAVSDADAGLEHVEYVCVSGEQLILDPLVERFFARRPGIELINLYGPTETHAVTTHRLSSDRDGWRTHTPIGLPISGVTAQVVDDTGHLAPLGVPGEMMLGGRCTADGYVDDEAKTAERFVPDPHGSPGSVRYRTGDKVLWSDTGALIFLGRDDEQVKIRGFRVELGELESAVLSHPSVAEAAAAVRGEGADRHLLLFIRSADSGGDGAQDEISSLLKDTLPAYMMPAAVLPVAEIPKTGNGKVDRQALLGRADDLMNRWARQREEDAAPASDDPLQSRLLRLWSELLSRSDLTVDRSLLESGAHSLTVLNAVSRIEQQEGVRLAILDVFGNPTVRDLAALIRRAEQ